MKENYLAGFEGKIAKLLTLLDRNPYSKTCGCFDRNFWHYKIKDFPSGMSQEFALALALVHELKDSANPFYKKETLASYVASAIQYAHVSSRKDGSCDDYFPYERALGAAVFSLYALTESYLLLDLGNKDHIDFFKLRAKWIMTNDESGRLSNHHAIAALALYNVYLITNDAIFKKAAQKKVEQVLEWQNEEGWYEEYEGCDPGYLTVSIDFLAQYYKKTEDAKVLASLEKALDFFYQIQNPDGTLSPEVGSRFTAIFHPNGFEILAEKFEKAARVANSYLSAKIGNRLPDMSDDYVIGHMLISELNAFKNFKRRDVSHLNTSFETQKSLYYKKAGLFIRSNGKKWAIFNLLKGGSGRIYDEGKLVYSDSGVVAKKGKGLLVSAMVDPEAMIQIRENGFVVRKHLMIYAQKYATPLIFLLFRQFLFFFGPFKRSSQRLRKFLQKKMILGKKPAVAFYERGISFSGEEIVIKDRIEKSEGITKASLSQSLVPRYIAVSECFEIESLNRKFIPLEGKGGIFEKSQVV